MSDSDSLPVNQDDGLRRQGSYQSITSGQSVYLTANASSADDDEFHDFSSSSRSSLNSEPIAASDEEEEGDEEDNVDSPLKSDKGEKVQLNDGKTTSSSSGSRQLPSRKSIDEGSTTSTLEEDDDYITERRVGIEDNHSYKSTASDSDDEAEEEEVAVVAEVEEKGKDDSQSNKKLLRKDEQGNEIGAGGASNDEELIKEHVLRLCNEIAEASQPDFQKQAEIERASFEDVRLLRKLAISEGGLLSNQLRKRAWPVLLGLSLAEVEDKQHEKIPIHFPNVDEKIKELVQLDVNRVLKRFPPNLSEIQQDHIQSYLNNLILSVLDANPQAYYYQGFHDICLTFLLVCLAQNVPYVAYLCLDKLVNTSLKAFMEKTMDATHNIIYVIYALIEMENKALYNKIVLESKCPAAFCLAWVITWFSHTLPNDTDIFRLADFILGWQDDKNPSSLVPVFLSAALVLRNAEDIMNTVNDTDIASMHYCLSRLPVQVSIEPWLKDTSELLNKYDHHDNALLRRAIKIKQIQHNLWNEEPANRRPVSRRTNPLLAVGRFLFIRHRWVTVSLLVILAAYATQRYGYGLRFSSSSIFSPVRSFFQRKFQRSQD